jgi:hypothetical protein
MLLDNRGRDKLSSRFRQWALTLNGGSEQKSLRADKVSQPIDRKIRRRRPPPIRPSV